MSTVIPGTARPLRTFADGSVELKVLFDPMHRTQVMELFGEPGAPLAIARLKQEAAQETLQQESIAEAPKAPYGQQAKVLRLSAFFRTPDVWRCVGTDKHFLAWLRTQPCVVCKADPPNEAAHVRRNEAAHVRRIAEGAGVGIKPEYCAIPLCRIHHQIQETAGYASRVEACEEAKLWSDKKRVEHVQEWCWQTLKIDLGHEHWNAVPTAKLLAWAQKHDVVRYLPAEYRRTP